MSGSASMPSGSRMPQSLDDQQATGEQVSR